MMLTLNLISDHFLTHHLRFYINGPTRKFPTFHIKLVPLPLPERYLQSLAVSRRCGASAKIVYYALVQLNLLSCISHLEYLTRQVEHAYCKIFCLEMHHLRQLLLLKIY